MFKVVEVVKDLVLSIDRTVDITKVVDLGNNLYELHSCNLKYVNKCNVVSYDGQDFTVLEVFDGYFTVNSLVTPTIGSYEINEIPFIHGTYVNAKQAITKMDQEHESYDNLIFFVSTPLMENINLDPRKDLHSSVEVKVLLLAGNNREWCPDEHYNKAINPMRCYADLILESLEKRRGEFSRTYSADIVNVIDVGIYEDKKGMEESLFNAYFSGVVLTFDLNVLKTHKCCKKLK